MSGDIAVGAVVRRHHHGGIADIGTRPVEAALGGIRPCGQLGLIAPRGVLIGDAEADVIGVLLLAVPEPGVEVAVVVDDGAVGLPLQRVAVDPHGAERHGVKRLYGAVGQAHEDHALGVGGVVDGEAGAVIHSAGGQHLTGYGVHLVQCGAGVGV